ncbi:MAG: MerR family transcriptional regulator [Deltaproteobacteria bacterium]|nr:MerR family transcriptional regulator [Deltaproteobacteria bacterium]
MTRSVLTITEVARRLGIATKTIRVYEEEGFITIRRSSGRCLLEFDDLEVIVRIERLKDDLGVNLHGIGVILEMRQKIMELQSRLAEMEREFDRRLQEALAAQERQPDKFP